MQKECTTHSAEETERLGELIGSRLRGGEVIELMSDLGGGKTTFTCGLARGFGSNDRVASPSFTLSREYAAGDKRIVHFDFYRLAEAGIMQDETLELINDPAVVVVVEWADVVHDILPADRLRIAITAKSESERTITLSASKTHTYLLDKIIK